MGFFLKSRLSEAEAAAWFVGELAGRVRRNWPRIRARMAEELGGEAGVLERERAVQVQIVLAVVATHLEQLARLFGEEQAERLSKRICTLVEETTPGFQGLEDLEAYRVAWRRGAATGAPCEVLAAHLRRRLGEGFPAWGRRPSPGPSPGSDALTELLSAFDVSWWAHLRWRYRVVPDRDGPPAGRT